VGRRRAGFAAGQAARRALDKRGCVSSTTLNPPGPAGVFILGDLAHFEQDGHQVPGVAQPAMQMGDHVAKMIAADLAGKPRPAFRYFDKGDMATIGRMDAVAKVEWPFKAHMSGFPAWVTWLTVHIFFPDRLPQPHFRLRRLDLDLLHLHPRRAPHHRRPASPRLAYYKYNSRMNGIFHLQFPQRYVHNCTTTN
jgi:hypothetical protein